jgi:hypothetical protein
MPATPNDTATQLFQLATNFSTAFNCQVQSRYLKHLRTCLLCKYPHSANLENTCLHLTKPCKPVPTPSPILGVRYRLA